MFCFSRTTETTGEGRVDTTFYCQVRWKSKFCTHLLFISAGVSPCCRWVDVGLVASQEASADTTWQGESGVTSLLLVCLPQTPWGDGGSVTAQQWWKSDPSFDLLWQHPSMKIGRPFVIARGGVESPAPCVAPWAALLCGLVATLQGWESWLCSGSPVTPTQQGAWRASLQPREMRWRPDSCLPLAVGWSLHFLCGFWLKQSAYLSKSSLSC